jgi:putative two-component system response regulator
MRDAVIFGLAKLAESRDPDTGMHLERISLYSTRLARAARKHPRFRNQITPSFVQTIGISSALHDIGKVGVQDAILLKPGPLTSMERARITDHARIGGECIYQIQRRIGDSSFLKMAHDIAMHHHERWDGTGYPTGLVGEAIPLSARIVAIADVYDALSVKRVYKEALPHGICVERITATTGQQFDPDLVEIFLSVEAEFKEIAERFRDNQKSQAAEAYDVRDELLMTKEQADTLSQTVEGKPSEKAGQEGTRPSLKVVAGL